MLALAIILLLLDPVTIAVGVIMLVHAWAIPELYANRGAKVVKPKARAGDAGGGDRARAARRPRRPPGARAARAHGAGDGARGARRVARGGGGRAARARAARALLVRAGDRTPTCRPRTASRTCCSRCAPTSRASRPWPTTRSRARAGACGGGCPSACARLWPPRPNSTEWIVGPREHSAAGTCRPGRSRGTMVGMTPAAASLSSAGLPVRRLALVPDHRPLGRRRPPLPDRPPAPRGPRGRPRRALRAPQARARLTRLELGGLELPVMGNSSAFGSLARKALAWAIVAVVAILLFKFVVAAVAGVAADGLRPRAARRVIGSR